MSKASEIKNIDERVVRFISESVKNKKKIGKNKFQVTISDLNMKIDELHGSNKLLSDELEIYKNNITSIQLQLQSKIIENENTSHKLKDALIFSDECKQKLEEMSFTNSDTVKKLEKEIQNLSKSIEKYSDLLEIERLESERKETIYNNLMDKHKTALCVIDKHTKDNERLQDSLSAFKSENSMHKSDLDKLHNEIPDIRVQVLNYKNENSQLRTQILKYIEENSQLRNELFEKDVLIDKMSAPELNLNTTLTLEPEATGSISTNLKQTNPKFRRGLKKRV